MTALKLDYLDDTSAEITLKKTYDTTYPTEVTVLIGKTTVTVDSNGQLTVDRQKKGSDSPWERDTASLDLREFLKENAG